MKLQLKPIEDQVLVITGASSGIGLATARLAAQSGARVVMAARNAEALEAATARFRRHGHAVVHVVADVGRLEDVKRIAQLAHKRFGGFDTWINNAGVSIFGFCEALPIDDQRRLFDTNFWGVVYGSLVAAKTLREQGGALINIGSEASDAAMPLQGIYSASKHAVKGFTDALRIELEASGAPISVTLIKPASIDTMFVPHAGNYLDVEPRLPKPYYAPEIVARGILYAAQHPKRDLYIGGASKLVSVANRLMPRVVDRVMRHFMLNQQRSTRPSAGADSGTLYVPGVGALERQGQPVHVCKTSLYSRLTTALRG